jgi:Domain of unknown function (DUF4124)
MKPTVLVAAVLMIAASAQASEVYKTTDAQGRPIYTDRPQTLPAERVGLQSSATDPAEVQRRYDEQMKQLASAESAAAEAAAKTADTQKARELTAEDRAKRCQDARQRYESYQNARRLYEPGATEGERRYLSSEEIDAARATAKQVMDEFCNGQ